MRSRKLPHDTARRPEHRRAAVGSGDANASRRDGNACIRHRAVMRSRNTGNSAVQKRLEMTTFSSGNWPGLGQAGWVALPMAIIITIA